MSATPEEIATYKLGLSLLGRRVRFRHQPDGPDRHVSLLNGSGMIELEGMTGQFAPELFLLMDADK